VQQNSRMRAGWGILVLSLLLSGCGSPTAPSFAAARGELTVVAGDTGAPVVGAQVTIAGRSYTTGPAGQLPLDGLVFDESQVRVQSEGFLLREARLPAAGSVSLWPVRDSYSDRYVRQLLYTSSDPGSPPEHPLMRIEARRVSIVPTEELRNDAAAMAVHREAIALLNEATQGQVMFTLDTKPEADVVFRVSVDSSARDGALTHRVLRRNAIIGGRIVFSARAGFQPAQDIRYVAHELGHALGLEHSAEHGDMMYYAAHPDSPASFSENERLTIRLLLQREAGNLFPDSDGHR
jgi:hypothetical protein